MARVARDIARHSSLEADDAFQQCVKPAIEDTSPCQRNGFRLTGRLHRAGDLIERRAMLPCECAVDPGHEVHGVPVTIRLNQMAAMQGLGDALGDLLALFLYW